MLKVLIIISGLVLSSSLSAQPTLDGTQWKVDGVDSTGTRWTGTTLTFESQTPSNDGAEVSGYFSWKGSNGSGGNEAFDGMISSDGRLSLRGTRLFGPVSGIILANYSARFSDNGTSIIGGAWSEGIPGTWTAELAGSPTPTFRTMYTTETFVTGTTIISAAEILHDGFSKDAYDYLDGQCAEAERLRNIGASAKTVVDAKDALEVGIIGKKVTGAKPFRESLKVVLNAPSAAFDYFATAFGNIVEVFGNINLANPNLACEETRSRSSSLVVAERAATGAGESTDITLLDPLDRLELGLDVRYAILADALQAFATGMVYLESHADLLSTTLSESFASEAEVSARMELLDQLLSLADDRLAVASETFEIADEVLAEKGLTILKNRLTAYSDLRAEIEAGLYERSAVRDRFPHLQLTDSEIDAALESLVSFSVAEDTSATDDRSINRSMSAIAAGIRPTRIIRSEQTSRFAVYTLPNRAWQQVSFPQEIGEIEAASLAEAPLTRANYGIDWIIYRYDSYGEQYEMLRANEALEPGVGYWIIQASGETVTLTPPLKYAVSTTSHLGGCDTQNSCFNLPIGTPPVPFVNRWTMIGNPFDEPNVIGNSSVSFYEGGFLQLSVTDLFDLDVLLDRMFYFDGRSDSYQVLTATDSLPVGAAYWLRIAPQLNLNGPVDLQFRRAL